MVTSVGVGGRIPRTLSLAATDPNPFVANTRIAWAMPGPARVTLEIRDLAGRPVVTLARRNFPAGEHGLTWNGRDDRGRAIPPGIYFVRLTADSRTLVRKLTKLE